MPFALPLLFFAAALTPEQRAIEYLVREVPAWHRDNQCYSCHNNGDAARALFLARRSGYRVPKAALSDTLAWLRQPSQWDQNHAAAAFGNPALAHIQFAAALAEAGADRQALRTAAESLLRYRNADGLWKVDAGGIPGAPATYGAALATYMATQTLQAAGVNSSGQAEALSRLQPANLVDAAALLLAAQDRADCRQLLLTSQNGDGGWGPQPRMPSEVFDTALAMLALREGKPVERARAFLVKAQLADGSWPETTRPGGQVSYAERLSTTGWALYALLKVRL